MLPETEIPHADQARGVRKAQLGSERSDNTKQNGFSQECIIGDLPKNQRDIVRVQLRTYKGTDLADIRVHYPADDGKYRPTAKGVSIKPVHLPRLIELLEAAHLEAQKRGIAGAA